MSHNATHASRRQFIHSGVAAAVGLTTGCLASSANAAQSERFELSIHQFSVKKLIDEGQLDTPSYPEFVKMQFGFTNVEFAVDFCADLLADPERGVAIKERSSKLGIRHRALLCGAEPLDSANEATRQDAIAFHLQWAQVAERLGCEYMRVRASTEGDKKQQLDHAAAGIGALCDAMKDSKVKLLVENITGCSNDPQWLIELVKRVGPSRLGLIADFGNFAGDIYEGMRQLMPFTKSVCTKSWEFDDQGKETKIDFQKMMAIVKDSDFRGCIAIEYLGSEPVNGVRKTADLIRKYS
ncbi:MAG: TIM barrel protein [Planctomycetales bacterium]|nr:TIM barrel protein [Planctomycetales bacterium]